MILFDPNPDGSRSAEAPVDARHEPGCRMVLVAAGLAGAVALASFAAGRVAGSHALQAAALVPLGAALTHGLDAAMADARPRARHIAALVKAVVLTVAGGVVLAASFGTLVSPDALPAAGPMGSIGLALAAVQVATMLLLTGHRGEARRQSALASARRGAIGHLVAVLAAAGVWASGSDWPDLIVAANLSALFLLCALNVLRQAWIEWRTGEDQGALSSLGFNKDFA